MNHSAEGPAGMDGDSTSSLETEAVDGSGLPGDAEASTGARAQDSVIHAAREHAQEIDEEALAQYLLSTPTFFERHPHVVTDMRLPSPDGSRVLSLHERQLAQLRDQNTTLQRRIQQLMALGHENDALMSRLQRFTRELLLARDAAEVPSHVMAGLKANFSVPLTGMRLWGVAPEFKSLAQAQTVDAESRELADSLHSPYCGLTGRYPQVSWLAESASAARSMALIALRQGANPRAFGLVVLASADPDRFQTGMATDFLERIGEIASAALSRLLVRPSLNGVDESAA